MWRRLGRLVAPPGAHPALRTHAALPTPLHLGGERYRVYYAARDAENRSSVAWAEVALRPEGPEVLARAEEPVLGPGPLGHFDDHGVYPSALVPHGDELRMYYIGWSPGPRRPLFHAGIGLAVSLNGGRTFRRLLRAPVVGRSEADPWMATSPCVRREGSAWRMWYTSGLGWEETPEGLVSRYHIQHATSPDGVRWERDGQVCVPLGPGERNVARPSVLHDRDGYRMWFCANAGPGYRIGYATSDDGVKWRRDDAAAGLGPGPEPWASEAVAYPAVVRHDGEAFLLYNGNGFGRDGFGAAVWEGPWP